MAALAAAGNAQTDGGCCRLPGLVLIKFPGTLVKREVAVLSVILLKNTAHTEKLWCWISIRSWGPAELPHRLNNGAAGEGLLRPVLADP